MTTADPINHRYILVIDDNLSICEDFRKVLKGSPRASSLHEARAALFEDASLDEPQEGFEVDCAEQGETGLAMVQNAVQCGNPYAVAFVDMLMPPGWDGIETITHLWRADPELEMVLCTAFPELLRDRLSHELAHSDKLLVLRKPFDNIEVWQLAHALTQKWQLAQQVKRQLTLLTETVAQRTQELQEMNEQLQLDIARRQRAEARLIQQAQELARSNAELEQFASVASHDLQEPLRVVISYLQLLAENYHGRLDADADEFIAYAVDGAQRMQQLIVDLLAYSRAGTRSTEFAPTACEQVLARVLVDLHMAIAESGAVVTHGPLPTVQADATQLGQVLQNLLGNALKFRSTQPPRIHVAAEKRGTEWTFMVRDNGIGLEPIYAERIFGLFQRLHSRTAYPGTGMGLAICKKIIERHGGRIWVESEPGYGATFFFTLPAE
jgi:signal transduction histidine kinase